MLEKVFKRAKQKHSEHSQENDLSSVYAPVDDLIALKAKADKLSFPLRHKSLSQFNGAKRSALRGRGLDFDEVRAYQAGDEIRAIDWRVTARTGETHTKVYKEEKEKPVYVLLDLRSPMFFGSRKYFKSVTACHIASLLAWACIKNGDRFGALVFSNSNHEELKPRSGNKAALGFIQTASDYSKALLANHETSTEKKLSLNNELEKLYQLIRPGSLVYLISDFHDLDEHSQKYLSLLSRHNDLVAIHVHDPLEQALPPAKRLLFTNTEANETSISELHANKKQVRENYQDYFNAKHQKNIEKLLDSKVQSLTVSTELEASEQLQQSSRLKRFA